MFNNADLPPLRECVKRLEDRMACLSAMEPPKSVNVYQDEALQVQVGKFKRLMEGLSEDWKRVVCAHLSRDHVYAERGERSWDLFYNELGSFGAADITSFMRQWIATRVLWVQAKKEAGEECYTASKRYSDHAYDTRFLDRHLSADSLWILDPSILVGLEILTLMLEVTEIDMCILRMLSKVKHLQRPGRIRIETITEPCTKKAMSSKDAQDHECLMCRATYALKYSRTKATEPAVKTKCGHIFGRDCLQEWLKKSETCPKCRTEIAGIGVQLSKGARTVYKKTRQIEARRMKLDEEIDSYFSKRPEVCYGEQMRELLDELRKIRRDAFAQEIRMDRIKV